MLDIEWSQCQFLASTSSHVLFVVFVVVSNLYHVPTVPLNCRCAIDEKAHDYVHHATCYGKSVRICKSYKLNIFLSLHEHMSPLSYVTRTVSILYEDVVQFHCHTCLLGVQS